MEVININVNKLTPDKNNPRNNTEAIQYVANSIKEFGFKVPLVIDSDNVVICGHTRLLAAKQLGIEEVPCIIADDLTDEQIKAFRLADNKMIYARTFSTRKRKMKNHLTTKPKKKILVKLLRSFVMMRTINN